MAITYRLWVKGYDYYHVYEEITCYGTAPLFLGRGKNEPLCGIKDHAGMLGVVHLEEGIPPGEVKDERCEVCLRSLVMLEIAE